MKKIIIQAVLIFLSGSFLIFIDGSGGYWNDSSWVSYAGGAICVLGILWYLIVGLFYYIKK